MSAVRPRGNKSDPPRQAANTGDVNSRENNPQPGFNRHIYLNLFCNVESQIETETRRRFVTRIRRWLMRSSSRPRARAMRFGCIMPSNQSSEN